jgi:hypothetical protein
MAGSLAKNNLNFASVEFAEDTRHQARSPAAGGMKSALPKGKQY